MDEQLGGGIDSISRKMYVCVYDVPCVFNKENFNQGAGGTTWSRVFEAVILTGREEDMLEYVAGAR